LKGRTCSSRGIGSINFNNTSFKNTKGNQDAKRSLLAASYVYGANAVGLNKSPNRQSSGLQKKENIEKMLEMQYPSRILAH
jgi:hypothetical protein